MSVLKRVYSWFTIDSWFWVAAGAISGIYQIFHEPHWGWKVFGVFMVFFAGTEAQRLLTEWKIKFIRQNLELEYQRVDLAAREHDGSA